MHHQIQYRPEIDGLRAIAVLAVIIFHAKLGFLPGGFVGVDIFFVISGYLITSIILNDEKQKNFSLLQFYERRIRRIFPALFVVILFTMLVGGFLFTPRDFNQLGWSAFASMAFFSNLYFAKQDGYFAPASETQPLLHTWSLGVEEQFYLVAPFIILMINRKFYTYRASIIAALFLASLAASIYGAHTGSRRIFFMPHVRAFELLIGVSLAMQIFPKLSKKWIAEVIVILGLAMILASFQFINSRTVFPSYWALVPAGGTGFLIYALSGSEGLIARFLSSRPIVSFGKISYSLYLWHWPLLAFAEYEYGHKLTSTDRIGLLLLAIVLSILTYLYIEQPARQQKNWFNRSKVYAFGVGTIAICGLACFAIVQTDGLPQRLSKDAQLLANTVKFPIRPEECSVIDRARRKIEPDVCRIGEISRPQEQFILWGDSHAEAVSGTVSQVANAEGLKGLNIFHHGCPAVTGLEKHPEIFKHCRLSILAFDKYIRNSDITDVIMAGRWRYYAEGDTLEHLRRDPRNRRFVTNNHMSYAAVFEDLFIKTIEKLTSEGKRVTIIGPAPEMPVHIPTLMIKSAMRGSFDDITIPRSSFDERQKGIMSMLKSLEQNPNVTIIYPHKKLCNEKVCFGSKNRVAYYFDDHHLFDVGAAEFAPELAQALRRIKQ
jgi:peptidoglycan/LPS O-acetylase OafA/YrhL